MGVQAQGYKSKYGISVRLMTCAIRTDAISFYLTCPSAIAAPEPHSEGELERYGIEACATCSTLIERHARHAQMDANDVYCRLGAAKARRKCCLARLRFHPRETTAQ
jgi:hypothetical protein